MHNSNVNNLEKILTEKSIIHIGKEFIRLFLFMLAIVVSCILFFFHSGYQKKYSIKVSEEANHLELMKSSMTRDLEVLIADLHVITNIDDLNSYIDNKSEESLTQLESRLAVFAADRKIYDQIRYIDNEGKEKARINFDSDRATVVPKNQLQNKKDRYYFQHAINMKTGKVYISPLDLNVEQGMLEVPLKPVLRVAAPVVDSNKMTAGIVVLNYRAGNMLDRFETTSATDPEVRYFLVNQEGYWLKDRETTKEWGFILEHGASFAENNQQVWREVKEDGPGKIETAEGIYIYDRILPQYTIDHTSDNANQSENNEEWLLFAYISAESLSFLRYLQNYSDILLILLCLVLLLGAGSWQIAVARVAKKKSEGSFRLLSRGLSQSPAAVVITNKIGNIIYVNPRFEQLTGFSSSEVLGENPRIFKSGKTSNLVYADLWQTIKEGETWVGDFENKDKLDRPYYVSAQISPIVNEQGQIEHFIAIQEDVTEKLILQRKLEKLATTDSLTGALNRGRFAVKCEEEGRRCERYKGALSLLVFDLDKFKNINDKYGHLCGDSVLKHFAETIKNSLRENDVFGRIGGEEFAALVVETDKVGAIMLAERLRQVIEDCPVEYEAQKIAYTVSIGVAQWLATDKNLDVLLKRADDALYFAKKNGRNRVEFL